MSDDNGCMTPKLYGVAIYDALSRFKETPESYNVLVIIVSARMVPAKKGSVKEINWYCFSLCKREEASAVTNKYSPNGSRSENPLLKALSEGRWNNRPVKHPDWEIEYVHGLV